MVFLKDEMNNGSIFRKINGSSVMRKSVSVKLARRNGYSARDL